MLQDLYEADRRFPFFSQVLLVTFHLQLPDSSITSRSSSSISSTSSAFSARASTQCSCPSRIKDHRAVDLLGGESLGQFLLNGNGETRMCLFLPNRPRSSSLVCESWQQCHIVSCAGEVSAVILQLYLLGPQHSWDLNMWRGPHCFLHLSMQTTRGLPGPDLAQRKWQGRKGNESRNSRD